MSQNEPRTRRPLIWICDDSPVESKLTERALGPEYEYEFFSDGSLVVERLAAGGRQPDVLLLDWVMPTMMGDEVCRFLRSHPATVELPVIVVTASRIETADVVQGLAVGANDYVARPFVAEELRARVDTAIRAKRLREVAKRERDRVATISRLGRAFVEARHSIEGVLDALASSLVQSLADGCAITFVASNGATIAAARHRSGRDESLLSGIALADPCVLELASTEDALARLPAAYHAAIRRFGMRALAVVPFPAQRSVIGMIAITRDGHSEPFEPDDLATIHTCIDYAAMAIENAQRFEAERSARAQLDAVFEKLPISIVLVDPDGVVTRTNPAASVRLPAGATLTRADGPVKRALAGETVRGVEIAVDNTYLRCSAVPLHDARGNVIAAVSAFEDVTAERAAAAERERTLEFQQYVMGIVSHDLRNPLASIHMGCEVLRQRIGGDGELEPMVLRLQTTSSRMQRIVDQLLDVTRARLGGGIPVEPQKTDLEEVVTTVIDELALAYPDRVFQPKLEHVRGDWDPDRLAQVVSNLVGNAIQHGAAESPVWIEAAREGSHALIRVRNVTTGAPISKEQEQTIFAPFRRHPRPGTRTGGLGLGLYIANEILRAHRGQISIDSDSSTTTFTVRLPIEGRPE